MQLIWQNASALSQAQVLAGIVGVGYNALDREISAISFNPVYLA
jgi:hypothetical protein